MSTNVTPSPTRAAPPTSADSISRIASGTILYGVGRVLPQALSFLLLPVYAAYLTPSDLGVLDLAGALGGFLTVLFRAGVPGAVARFYFEQPEGPALGDYVTTIAAFLLGTSLVGALCVGLAAPWLLEPFLPELRTIPHVALVLVAAVMSCNAELQSRLAQAREQAGYMARLNIARAIAYGLVAVYAVVGLELGAVGLLVAESLVSIGVFLQALRYLRPDLRGRLAWAPLRASLLYGAGILPVHLLGQSSPLLARLILVSGGSLEAVGIFGIAERFARPLSVLGTSFNQAYVPVYFASRKEGTIESELRLVDAARVFWFSAVGVALGVSAFAPPAIELLTPYRYHSAASLVPVLAAGFLVQAAETILGPEIFFRRTTWLAPLMSIAAIGSTLGVTAWLAPTHGAMGIAWGTAAGAAAGAAVSITISLAFIRLAHPWGRLVLTAVVGLALAGVNGLAGAGLPPLTRLALAAATGPAYLALLALFGDRAPKRLISFLAQRVGRLFRTHR